MPNLIMSMRKGQMFVVTAVFLTGLLFAVQQALLVYSSLDLSEPFRVKEHMMVRDAINSINETILKAQDCSVFDRNLKELFAALRDEFTSEGYLLELGYSIDCDSWSNTGPPAPLTVSIGFVGTYNARGILRFYHVQ
jgi:hypothetical protein